MNSIDTALQLNSPVIAVPAYEELQPLMEPGHRFLGARDGLWIEIRRPWVHVVWPIAICKEPVSIPYGSLSKKVELGFDTFPIDILNLFMTDALLQHPAEVGGVGIWNSVSQTFRYEKCTVVASGLGHLRQTFPSLTEDESVVFDFHSHGPIPAYFSDTDCSDVGSDVVLAGVVGNLNSKVEFKLSLFANGLHIPIDTANIKLQYS